MDIQDPPDAQPVQITTDRRASYLKRREMNQQTPKEPLTTRRYSRLGRSANTDSQQVTEQSKLDSISLNEINQSGTVKNEEKKVLSVRFIKTDPLLAERRVTKPFVRMHVIDMTTKKRMKKIDLNEPAVLSNEPPSIDYLLPVLSKVTRLIRFHSRCLN